MSLSERYSELLLTCSLEVFEQELDIAAFQVVEHVKDSVDKRTIIKGILKLVFERRIPHKSPANHSILSLIKQCDCWDEEDLPLLQKVDNHLLTLLSTDSEMIEPILKLLLEDDAGIYSYINRESYDALVVAALLRN